MLGTFDLNTSGTINSANLLEKIDHLRFTDLALESSALGICDDYVFELFSLLRLHGSDVTEALISLRR